MNHLVIPLIFFIGLTAAAAGMIYGLLRENRKLRKKIKHWENKYQKSEESWYKFFEELEKHN